MSRLTGCLPQPMDPETRDQPTSIVGRLRLGCATECIARNVHQAQQTREKLVKLILVLASGLKLNSEAQQEVLSK